MASCIVAEEVECQEKTALGPRQIAPRIWISSEEIDDALRGRPGARRVEEKGQLRVRRVVKKPRTPALTVPEPPRTPMGKIRLQHPGDEMLAGDVMDVSQRMEPIRPVRQQARERSDGLFIPGPYYIPPARADSEEADEVSLGEDDYDWINVKKPEQVAAARGPIVIARSPYMIDEQ